MKISSNYNFFPKPGISNAAKVTKPLKKQPSFGNIYIEEICDVSTTIKPDIGSNFSARDALLLNKIACNYPYQDCFIRSGIKDIPYLEFREKPIAVQKFMTNFGDEFQYVVDPNDKAYPAVQLVLYKNEQLSAILGRPSYVSLNPSLANTVMAAYEVHKKLMEKKYRIMSILGKNDDTDLGQQTVIDKAHKQIRDVEVAVTRVLMEDAYNVYLHPPIPDQLYASNYLKVQSRIADDRKLQLTTSTAELEQLNIKNLTGGNYTPKPDLCREAMELYPDLTDNLKRIDALIKIMNKAANFPEEYL